MDGDEAEGFAHYDVRLQISPDGGKTWQDAPAEMIPASGLEVTLPYPAGTGKDTHDFFVSHMFTGGEKAGTTELPAVTKTETGIRFTVTGLSPVSVAWLPVVYEVKVADVSNGTVTTDVSQAAGGTQVTVTVTPKSGYELSKLAVKTADGTSCPVTAGKSGKYSFTMPHGDVTVTATFSKETTKDPVSPETGDHLQPVLWGSIAAVSMLSLVAIAVMFFRKKKLP